MDAPLVQPRLLAFITVKFGAVGGHQLSPSEQSYGDL